MPVDENTLILVSADAPPVRLMRLISSAHRSPKAIRITVRLLMPRIMPMPAPARALCPRASEKKAILRFTAMVPSSASRGVRSSSASSAFFINWRLNISKGRILSMTA